jgi:hypothetical protein
MPDIETKNPGILEVPKDKKVNELPLSHFENLVDKKGYAEVIRALTNLEVWNKDKNKSLSDWASATADKLKKKFRPESKIKSIIEQAKRKTEMNWRVYAFNKENNDLVFTSELFPCIDKAAALKRELLEKDPEQIISIVAESEKRKVESDEISNKQAPKPEEPGHTEVKNEESTKEKLARLEKQKEYIKSKLKEKNTFEKEQKLKIDLNHIQGLIDYIKKNESDVEDTQAREVVDPSDDGHEVIESFGSNIEDEVEAEEELDEMTSEDIDDDSDGIFGDDALDEVEDEQEG